MWDSIQNFEILRFKDSKYAEHNGNNKNLKQLLPIQEVDVVLSRTPYIYYCFLDPLLNSKLTLLTIHT